jgi:chromosome segregation protein
VHLKSLTLRGFKSFASTTTLRFEPGITAIVGPNGAGKSNVVDAIAWVLGEQGAKSLRGGKMEDVIFAGTAGRPPLGRAEVILTIDNTDNRLQIDFTEVSITRRMFRDGASEYEINGESARLLDIQELLSDSGIGREMHVIVGQGQLDAVLQARPEDRRMFIEEAAGVLKHRKRKEKALRKLEAMQGNLTRLTDLTAELRRQLKPLGKQAEIARRAAAVAAELRDSRLRLLADDLVTLRDELHRDVADENAIRARRVDVEAALAVVQAREGELEQAIADDGPLLAAAQETWYRLAALEERFRGTASLAAERARHLAASALDTRPGRDPDALEAEAATTAAEQATLQQQLADSHAALTAAASSRQDLEATLAEAERAIVAAARAAADRREGLATLAGQVSALKVRATAAADEIARLTEAAAASRDRAASAEAELTKIHAQVGALDEGEVSLDEQHEAALAEYERAQAKVRELLEAQREAEQARSTWVTRRDALALGLTRKDGAGALLDAGSRVSGVLGSVAALLNVNPGNEAALAAALGPLADAVAVASLGEAVAAVQLLKADDGGRASIAVGAESERSDRAGWPQLPPAATWALDVVRVPDALYGSVASALNRVAIVPDLPAAQRLVADNPQLRAVTRDGDVLGPHWATGGSASAPSAIEIQAAVDEAEHRCAEAALRAERLQAELGIAHAEAAGREAGVQSALRALHESDAQLSAAAEQMAQLGESARSASGEADRLEQACRVAAEARDRDLAGLTELEARLRSAEGQPVIDPDRGVATRDALARSVEEARRVELEARLTVRTDEERVWALAGRVDQLRHAAEEERAAQQRHAEAIRTRARAAAVATAVHDAATAALAEVGTSRSRAAAEREQIQHRRVVREGELLAVRNHGRELEDEIARLTDEVHRDEIARAEQRLRIESIESRAVDEFGVEVEALLAEYGPDELAPPSSLEMAEYHQARERGEAVTVPQPGPFHRPTQEKRAARAEQELALLGRVNPLALEEFAALEERHLFLSSQLEDLKATRRDLLTVIKEVDDRILDVFTSAYEDVACEFETVFATLFPGGDGRLVLTDPDDMLLTGIDVEARPAGKKVKRLSLLSGGERSLTAVALLVAIFRARPSPFYVLDEIEAALDDTNLGRLLTLINQLRSSSQILLITHQKRTMEIADALYGVTMSGDGITQVISQRLRDVTADNTATTTP